MPAEHDLETIIAGMAGDLIALRQGQISVPDARARAELGKQIIAGYRLVLSARKYLADQSKPVGIADGSIDGEVA